MLINPSPTTLLAMWVSGCAASGAGSGGQAGQDRKGRQGRTLLPTLHIPGPRAAQQHIHPAWNHSSGPALPAGAKSHPSPQQ